MIAAWSDQTLRRATGARLGDLHGVRRIDHGPARTEWRGQDDDVPDRVGAARPPMRDVSRLAERHGDATLGVLPHVHGLYGRLTVREHIPYFGALRGLRGGRLEARVSQLIEQLGLNAAAESFTRDALGGPAGEGRASPARWCTLLSNLILDEPTSGLDVMSTRALHALLRSLRDQGACVLFSSHVMHEVACCATQW